LARNKLITTYSGANLPTFMKIELNALKYCLFCLSNDIWSCDHWQSIYL